LIDSAAKTTGYGFSFGYIDDTGLQFGHGAGDRTIFKELPVQVNGTINADDAFELGSGTKGYTATAIMRLVDEGKIKLSDLAYLYTDGPMTAGWNQTMEKLFGPWGNKVTVRDLIFMQSGIGDYEIGTFDQDTLLNSHEVHDPMEPLVFMST